MSCVIVRFGMCVNPHLQDIVSPEILFSVLGLLLIYDRRNPQIKTASFKINTIIQLQGYCQDLTAVVNQMAGA